MTAVFFLSTKVSNQWHCTVERVRLRAVGFLPSYSFSFNIQPCLVFLANVI